MGNRPVPFPILHFPLIKYPYHLYKPPLVVFIQGCYRYPICFPGSGMNELSTVIFGCDNAHMANHPFGAVGSRK